MAHEHVFHFDQHARLDSPERRERQPPGPLVELIARSSPQVVADLGAGTGYFALPLAQQLPAARVICLDLEPRMLGLLDERAAGAGMFGRLETRLVTESPALPLTDGEVDAVVLVNLWHELGDPPATLAELARSLRSGGRLVICDWAPEGDREAGPPVEHRVAAGAVEAVLSESGWSAVRRVPLYRDHWTVTAERS